MFSSARENPILGPTEHRRQKRHRRKQQRAVAKAKQKFPEWWWRWQGQEYGLAFERELYASITGAGRRKSLTGVERAVARILCQSVQWGHTYSDIPLTAVVQKSGFSQPTVSKAIKNLSLPDGDKEAWFDVDRSGRHHKYHPKFSRYVSPKEGTS